jgi:hypothetical protein
MSFFSPQPQEQPQEQGPARERMAASDTRTAAAVMPGRVSAERIVTALFLVAAVLWGAQVLGVGGFVVFAFGGPLGLLLLLVVAGLAWLAVAGVLKLSSGRRHPMLAAGAVIATVGVVGVAIADHGIPIWWIPGGFDLAYPLIGVAVGAVTATMLGRWWLRAVGVLVIIAVVAGAAVQNWRRAADAQAETDAVAAAQRRANFEYFLEAGAHPMVPVSPGAEVLSIEAGGDRARTRIVTAAGGVVDVYVDTLSDADSPTTPCLWLAGEGDAYDPASSLEAMSAFCVRDGELWRRPDGTALLRVDDGRVLAVVAVHDGVGQQAPEAHRPATPDEVAAVLGSLRPMTQSEMRDRLADQWGVG